jgi:flagellar biosynthesis protein FliQ
MEVPGLLEICREAVYILIKLSLPILLITLVVGLLVALLQALTQIQENTLSFVPKILAVFVALLFFTPYMVDTLKIFNEQIMSMIINIE